MKVFGVLCVLLCGLVLTLSCGKEEHPKVAAPTPAKTSEPAAKVAEPVPAPAVVKPPEPVASAPEVKPEQPVKPESAATQQEPSVEQMSPRERATEATSLVKAGREEFRQGNIDSAISKFERALQLTPDFVQARKDYAEMLYLKAQTYSSQSDELHFRSLGKEFDELTRSWKQAETALSEEEKAKLEKDSDEALRKAQVYYRKSLEQLQTLDKMVASADQDVICAMGFIHTLLLEYDQAKACFQRVLESKVVDEKIKEKIRAAVQAIEQFEKSKDRWLCGSEDCRVIMWELFKTLGG